MGELLAREISEGERYRIRRVDAPYSGTGVITWPDGSRYEGSFQDGHLHGHGVFTWPAGCSFTGEWGDDVPHGQGVFVWSNGARSEGEWIRGRMKMPAPKISYETVAIDIRPVPALTARDGRMILDIPVIVVLPVPLSFSAILPTGEASPEGDLVMASFPEHLAKRRPKARIAPEEWKIPDAAALTEPPPVIASEMSGFAAAIEPEAVCIVGGETGTETVEHPRERAKASLPSSVTLSLEGISATVSVITEEPIKDDDCLRLPEKVEQRVDKPAVELVAPPPPGLTAIEERLEFPISSDAKLILELAAAEPCEAPEYVAEIETERPLSEARAEPIFAAATLNGSVSGGRPSPRTTSLWMIAGHSTGAVTIAHERQISPPRRDLPKISAFGAALSVIDGPQGEDAWSVPFPMPASEKRPAAPEVSEAKDVLDSAVLAELSPSASEASEPLAELTAELLPEIVREIRPVHSAKGASLPNLSWKDYLPALQPAPSEGITVTISGSPSLSIEPILETTQDVQASTGANIEQSAGDGREAAVSRPEPLFVDPIIEAVCCESGPGSESLLEISEANRSEAETDVMALAAAWRGQPLVRPIPIITEAVTLAMPAIREERATVSETDICAVGDAVEKAAGQPMIEPAAALRRALTPIAGQLGFASPWEMAQRFPGKAAIGFPEAPEPVAEIELDIPLEEEPAASVAHEAEQQSEQDMEPAARKARSGKRDAAPKKAPKSAESEAPAEAGAAMAVSHAPSGKKRPERQPEPESEAVSEYPEPAIETDDESVLERESEARPAPLTSRPKQEEATAEDQNVLILPDGGKYAGEVENGRPHGHGAMNYADGSRYIGDWQDGRRNGQGSLTSADGAKYVGEWNEDSRHGYGTLTTRDGRKYSGDWKNDRCNGQGMESFADGKKYEGQFKDGKYHGQGTLILPDGKKYIGQFKNGLSNGKGKLIFPNGKYEGEFKDNKYHGQGILIMSDGRKYTGQLENGLPHGQGVMVLANGTKYVGEFKNGRFVKK